MQLSEVRKEYDVDTYRASLKIDQHRLDDMLMQQPIIQQTIAEMSAELGSMRDAAKERVARVDAQAAKTLRNRLMVEEGKASEARIDREIPLTIEHKEAFFVYNELCALAAQWEALTSTARNRAFVLRDLVSLYTSNFFTDTSFRSQSNPQAVKELEHQQARAALAQGRRARRTLSGIHGEVELLASVDDNSVADAVLNEPAESKTVVQPARSTSRSTSRSNPRTTNLDKSKTSATQGVDKRKAKEDTIAVSQNTDDFTEADVAEQKSKGRRELKDRLRNRSNKRAIDAESGNIDETSGANVSEIAETQADEKQKEDVTTTVDSPRPRRRRHSRERSTEST
jgi:hypothetical protein